MLFSIILLFSLLGNLYFSNLRSGEAINFSFVNFARIQFSANLVIRVVTGEDWHTIFRDAMVTNERDNDKVCYLIGCFFLFVLDRWISRTAHPKKELVGV